MYSNCHSTTDTWRGKNKPYQNRLIAGKVVQDEVLLDSLRSHTNVRQALLAVGLAAKGNNYNRTKHLLSTLS